MASRYERDYNRLRNNFNRRIDRARKKGYATVEKLPTYRQAKAAGTLSKSRSVLRKASKNPIGYAGVQPSKSEAKTRGYIKEKVKGKTVYKLPKIIDFVPEPEPEPAPILEDEYEGLLGDLQKKLDTYSGMVENFSSWLRQEVDRALSATATKKKYESLMKAVRDTGAEFEQRFNDKITEAEQDGSRVGDEKYSEYFDAGEVDIYELGVAVEEKRSVVSLFESLQSAIGTELWRYLYETAKYGNSLESLFSKLDFKADTFSDIFESLTNYIEDEEE